MRLFRLLPLLLLAGCAVGPDFEPPAFDTPMAWNDASARQADPAGKANVTPLSDPDPQWWTAFGDAELNSLIERAQANNPDLQMAVLRIEEARAGETAAAAAGLPHLNAQGSYMREQLGLKGLVRDSGNSIGSFTGGATGASANPGSFIGNLYQPVNLLQASLDSSWELDLFGRVRRSVEEAGATIDARIEARNDALVSLEAEVATAYAQLRAAQEQNRIAAEDLKVEIDIVDLTMRRRNQGLTTDLDVDNARTQLEITQSQIPQFEAQTTLALNTIAVLLGQVPGTLDKELLDGKSTPTLPPELPVGLPSTLAERRPDIREATAQLHVATAALGVAIADTWPDITLTGSIGTRSTEAQGLAHWANHFYSAGPSISLPIFQGGQLTANIQMATAQQKEAAIGYQKAVLNALKEVENALASYRSDRARQESLKATVATASDGLYLARNRYEHGLSSFIDVLTTENQLVTAKQQLVDSSLAVTGDVVQLYKALGGGWQTEAAKTPDTPRLADRPDTIVIDHVFEE